MEKNEQGSLHLSGKQMTIGITGGIASGKSVVAELIGKQGFPVFLADPVAKELMVSNDRIRTGLIALFGEDVYHPDGELNRTLIGGRIFTDNSARNSVNNLVHPAVWQAFLDFCKTNQKSSFIFHESALTFQTGLNKKLDLVIFIESDEKIRLTRALKREGMTPETFWQRVVSQGNLTAFRNQANFVITNNSSPEHLEQQLEKILRHITGTA